MSPATKSSAPTVTGRSRRLLLPLATMLAAGAVVIGSGADFTSTSSSALSTVTTGSFTQTNTSEGAAIFDLQKIKPGASESGTATITNDGDFAGDFTLVEENALNGFPEGDLSLVVTDTTVPDAPVEVFTGTIGELGEQGLGTIAPGESRTYTFDVALDQAAGDDAQNVSAEAVYTWNATQSADAED